MKIVFHGTNAGNFRHGFEALLDAPHEIVDLPDELNSAAERGHYASADIIVGTSQELLAATSIANVCCGKSIEIIMVTCTAICACETSTNSID